MTKSHLIYFTVCWVSETYPEGNFLPAYDIKLYTLDRVLNSKVYCRVCVAGSCQKDWDGAENSIFALSKSTAIAYEIGM